MGRSYSNIRYGNFRDRYLGGKWQDVLEEGTDDPNFRAILGEDGGRGGSADRVAAEGVRTGCWGVFESVAIWRRSNGGIGGGNGECQAVW